MTKDNNGGIIRIHFTCISFQSSHKKCPHYKRHNLENSENTGEINSLLYKQTLGLHCMLIYHTKGKLSHKQELPKIINVSTNLTGMLATVMGLFTIVAGAVCCRHFRPCDDTLENSCFQIFKSCSLVYMNDNFLMDK